MDLKNLLKKRQERYKEKGVKNVIQKMREKEIKVTDELRILNKNRRCTRMYMHKLLSRRSNIKFTCHLTSHLLSYPPSLSTSLLFPLISLSSY